MGDGRKPFLVRCGECDHVWPAGYVPMPMTRMADILRSARCPSCATPSSRLFAAGEADTAAWAQEHRR